MNQPFAPALNPGFYVQNNADSSNTVTLDNVKSPSSDSLRSASRTALVSGTLALALLLPSLTYAQAASTISGRVTNGTTGKPDANDTVSLISFGNGMQVSATAHTDAQGHYTLPIPAGGGMHLVRVDHQKAAYFTPAPEGTHTADAEVFDVAAEVPGVATEADVVRVQSDPGGDLNVTEDFFVRNASKPGRTQFSDHAFEFYLPPGAKVATSAARGPAGMPVESSPVPQREANRYAFVFPIRPGETRFQLSYSLPYPNKSLAFTHHAVLPTDNLVVLLPGSMQFSSPGVNWAPVQADPGAQTLVHKNVPAGQTTAFTVSGEGQLPRDMAEQGGQQQGGPQQGVTSQDMANNPRPGGGLGPPIDTPDPLHKYKGWLLGALGLVLLGGAVWLAGGRKRPQVAGPVFEDEPVPEPRQPVQEPRPRPSPAAVAGGPSATDVLLGHALLALETDRDSGRLQSAQYAAAYAAIEEARRRLRPPASDPPAA